MPALVFSQSQFISMEICWVGMGYGNREADVGFGVRKEDQIEKLRKKGVEVDQ